MRVVKNLLIKRLRDGILALGLLTQAGCLISEEPFFQKEDRVFDERLLGDFKIENYSQPLSITHWESEKDSYRVVVPSDSKYATDCVMIFHGVLFRVGTNRFLDLIPARQPCDRVSGTVSPLEILQGLTQQPLHLLVRVDIQNDKVNMAYLDTAALQAAMKKSPELFKKVSGRMIADSKQQREFLLRFGNDTNTFNTRYEFQKIPPKQ